ncbi:MAG: beta galactosidase jelly roll domain-containing protein [Bacteroidetes bacterium]|nr:beta galactosidase jelly roll domain-containing protein [Bacteroidota bacterium]
MKKNLLSFLIFLTAFASVTAQHSPLPVKWKFSAADQPDFSSPGWDDSQWPELKIPGNWENQGYPNLNGIAWYRVHFTVKKELLTQDLVLLAGKIDDADQTFLNGVQIGSTGPFPPAEGSAWNEQRAYPVPAGLLKEENVLAIRVFDGQGGGGLHSGLVGLYSRAAFLKELNAGPAPKKSFYQITTSNGLISAVFNEKLNLIEAVWPHIFQMFDLNKPVEPFLRNLTPDHPFPVKKVGYLDNTHVVKVDYAPYSLSILAPFSNNEKILVIAASGKRKEVSDLKFNWESGSAKIHVKEVVIGESGSKMDKIFLFTFSDSLHNNEDLPDRFAAETRLSDLVKTEANWMKSVFKRAHFPAGLSPKEKNLAEQSVSVLKMGQVSQNEIFPKSRGQILASLAPGNWTIAWLRDGTYAVTALTHLGLFDEARQALDFYLTADAGYYEHFIWTDGQDHGTKVPYRLSVCRYFGTGKEESDFTDAGPNIELDGFGLFLLAWTDYIRKSGDLAYYHKTLPVVTAGAADPILAFIEPDNLIRKESGPWEQHLPGRKQAFTSIVNSAGLREFASLLKDQKTPGSDRYFTASDQLKMGILEHLLVDGRYLKGFREAEKPGQTDYYDGGTIEAFTQSVLTDPALFKTHFAEYEKALRISPRRGFSRLNNPDWYTISEWPFLDTRISLALLRFGEKKKALKLYQDLTDYAALNHGFIAELYNYSDENYGGAVPMVGYGAGAWLLLAEAVNSRK